MPGSHLFEGPLWTHLPTKTRCQMIADNKGNNSHILDILHKSLFDGQNLDFVKILKIAALSLLDLLHKFKW